MRLSINPSNGEATLENGQVLERDRFYDLDDHPDHSVVLRMSGRQAVVLQITTKRTPERKKRKLVQTGRIQLLSATNGRCNVTGAPRTQFYSVDLNPEKAIWPFGDVVEQLLREGIEGSLISPMWDTLYDSPAAHSSPQMKTDGSLTRSANPGGNPYGMASEELLPSVDFTVTGATWAILHFDDCISHIYLWPGASDTVGELLKAIAEIEHGSIAA